MSGLSNDFVHKLRVQLENDKTQIATRIGELTKQDPFNDPDRVNDNADPGTEASEEAGHDRVHAIVEELKKKQENIVHALSRMDAGIYGICAHCAAVISEERLMILPTATLCLECEQVKPQH